MDVSINNWSVLAAAVASMIVGSAWYGFVFGKTWKRLMGFTDASMNSMPLSPKQAMAGGFVTAVLMSYVLAWMAGALSLVSASDALGMAFWVWLGFFVPLAAGSWLWEGRSFKLFLFNAAQWLIALSVMSMIVVRWM